MACQMPQAPSVSESLTSRKGLRGFPPDLTSELLYRDPRLPSFPSVKGTTKSSLTGQGHPAFRCSPSHQLTVLRPSPASRLELRSYHDRSYIDALFADPPGPDPASCKEFGLEDVITALIHSVALYALLDTGLCSVSWFQRIRSRNSCHDTDRGTGTRRRQV